MARQQHKKGNGNRKNNGNRKKEFTPRKERVEVKEITYSSALTVQELAEKLNRNASEIIKLLFMMGTMVTINSTLDDETIELAGRLPGGAMWPAFFLCYGFFFQI